MFSFENASTLLLFPHKNISTVWHINLTFSNPPCTNKDFKIRHRRIFKSVILHQFNKNQYGRYRFQGKVRRPGAALPPQSCLQILHRATQETGGSQLWTHTRGRQRLAMDFVFHFWTYKQNHRKPHKHNSGNHQIHNLDRKELHRVQGQGHRQIYLTRTLKLYLRTMHLQN